MDQVVVVGGGLGGLAAAALIGRAGRRVVVVERARALGGRAQTHDEDGFLMNLGAHALYRGGAAADVYRELGVNYTGRSPVTVGLAIRGGRGHALPTGPMSLFFGDLMPVAARFEAAKLFAGLATIEAPPGMSVLEWAEATTRHVTVKEMFLALARVTTYANAPTLQDAAKTARQLALAMRAGVLYLDGGWATLVEGLRRAAKHGGAEIVTGRDVVQVLHDDRVHGVVLDDGRTIAATEVIVTGGPRGVSALTKSAAVKRWAETLVPAHAACLDIAVSHLPRAKLNFALGIDTPLYVSVHSVTARLAPAGGALIHAAKYLPAGSSEHQDNDKVLAEIEGAVDLLQPGWRDVVVHRRFLPRLVVTHAIDVAEARPGPAVPDVHGLYVVGDWVGGTGALSDATLASAREAASLVGARRAAA